MIHGPPLRQLVFRLLPRPQIPSAVADAACAAVHTDMADGLLLSRRPVCKHAAVWVVASWRRTIISRTIVSVCRIESQAFNFLRARPAAHELRYLISTMATCTQKAWFRDRARDSGPQSPNHRGSPWHFCLSTRGRRRSGRDGSPAPPRASRRSSTSILI